MNYTREKTIDMDDQDALKSSNSESGDNAKFCFDVNFIFINLVQIFMIENFLRYF